MLPALLEEPPERAARRLGIDRFQAGHIDDDLALSRRDRPGQAGREDGLAPRSSWPRAVTMMRSPSHHIRGELMRVGARQETRTG